MISKILISIIILGVLCSIVFSLAFESKRKKFAIVLGVLVIIAVLSLGFVIAITHISRYVFIAILVVFSISCFLPWLLGNTIGLFFKRFQAFCTEIFAFVSSSFFITIPLVCALFVPTILML